MNLRAGPGAPGAASALSVERRADDGPAPTAAAAESASPRRPVSLQTRSLIAASLALAAFLGLSGFALDQAFRESSLQQLRDRLQGYVWSYLSGSDVTVSGRLVLPEFPPDQRFDRPQSGLYAGVAGKGINWESPSAIGRELPFGVQLEPGQTRFVGPVETNIGGVYVFSQGVDYAYGDGSKSVRLTFHIAEHRSALDRQMQVFRRTLWTWVFILGMLLLAVQLGVLRWSLTPLRKVERELSRVERGEAERLPGHYPRELEGLTETLNGFIESERWQRTRYRNTLADLAHSLKTPLAVLRNQLDSGEDGARLRAAVDEQVARMDQIVAYQLSRAATSGHTTFAAALDIVPAAEEIVRSLEKVYAERNALCEFDIDPAARFHGERGDLMEVLGNLLENAFKWCGHRVLLTVRRSGPIGARRHGLSLVVEDDGPGIAPENVERVLQRGVRGDERVKGHGIGLAIVQDIVKAHRGEISVDRSPELGGARFSVVLPAG
jgi:two-component system sensor histidine kinase PhoQ